MSRDLRSVASAHSAMRVMPLRKPWPMPYSRPLFLVESRYDRLMRALGTSRAFVALLGTLDFILLAVLAWQVFGRR